MLVNKNISLVRNFTYFVKIISYNFHYYKYFNMIDDDYNKQDFEKRIKPD